MKKKFLLALLCVAFTFARSTAQTYCTPSFTYGDYSCSYYGMTFKSFSVSGESGSAIVDSAACDGSGYKALLGETATFLPGSSYSLNVTAGGTYPVSAEVYIDFNDDGVFDSTESVGGYNNFYSTAAITLSIPTGAATGSHRMRAVLNYYYYGTYPGINPCGATYYGEVRDYTAVISSSSPCSGTPIAGTASASVSSACASMTVTLSDAGFTAASGIGYQWQSSPDSASWSNIAGATSSSYSVTGITAATYYQLVVSCGDSSSANSYGVKVAYAPCYCTPASYYGWYYSTYYSGYSYYNWYLGISTFSLAGYSGSSISDSLGAISSYYADRTSAISAVSLQQAGAYSGTVSYNYAYYYYENAIWIDFNDDGTFDATENVTGVFGTPTEYVSSSSFTMSIPMTAAAGTHRLRLREALTYYWGLTTSMDPCSYTDGTYYYYYGQTADYLATIVALPSCIGAPATGTATSSVVTACSTGTIHLSDAGTAVAAGIGYQWQSSPDSSTWTNISGATDTGYSFSGLSATTYYQLVVSCTDGSTAASNGVKVLYTPCYCTPASYYGWYYSTYYSGYSYYNWYLGIGNFSLTGYSGSAISDSLGTISSYYADRTSAVSAVNLQQAGSYSGTVTYNYAYYYYENAIWIDFNDDGTFDATENVTGVFGTPTEYVASSSYTMNIPMTASVGTHRLRVREALTYYWGLTSSMDPCNYTDGTYYYYYGQTADYLANIVSLPSCSGVPAAGTATSSVVTACSTGTIHLSDAGTAVAAGISYQWQSSPDSSTWTNISGATDTGYSLSGLSATTYYQLVVSCTDGSSAASNGVKVLYTPCYCTPESYYGWYYSTYYSGYSYYNWYLGIGSFSLTGYSGSSISDSLGTISAYYADRTSAVSAVNLQQAGSYSGTVTYNYGYYYYENAIWIDFNDDGTFDATENVTGVFGTPTAYVSSSSFTMSIPMTAATGTHRLRLREALTYYWGLTSSMDPCNYTDGTYYYYYGQTADYLANIVSLPSCSGTPATGTATSSAVTACATDIVHLSDAGTAVAAGISYQWQSSPDSATWTNISGATDTGYSLTGATATTYYQLLVSCTDGSSVASNGVKVLYTPCYCTPQSYYGWYYSTYYHESYYNWYVGLANFSLTGYSGSSINDSLAAIGTYYADRTSAVSAVNLQQAGSYTGYVRYNYAYYYYENAIWIDFNDDGTFDATENVTGVFGTPTEYVSSSSYTMNIPLAAAAGTHRLRLREAVTYYWGTTSSMDPCNYTDGTYYYYYGQTADYLANIVALPSCGGIASGGTASATLSTACSSDTFAVSITGVSGVGGVTYQWQSSTDGSTWTNISGATNTSNTVTGLAATTYYQCVTSCTDGSSATSSTDTVTFVPCYCTPETYYGYYYGSSYSYYYYYSVNTFSLAGYSGTSINDTLSTISSYYANRTSAVSAVQLQQGGSYTGTIAYNYTAYGYEDAIWIDFNDNGTFEASENVTGTLGVGSYTYVSATSYTLNVPLTATAGTHRMRLREAMTYSWALSSSMDPCSFYDGTAYYYYGQTADYLADIVTLPSCSGITAGGTASAAVAEACSSDTFVVSISGSTVASGITYQWQSSTDGSTWTNITGATNTSYSVTGLTASTLYQCLSACGDGSSATSTPVTVTYAPCYCTPVTYYSYYWGSAYSYYSYYAVNYFSLTGYDGTAINDSLGAITSYYTDRTSAVSTVKLQEGGSYSGYIRYNYDMYGYQDAIWIDFNDDGTFESSENVTGTLGAGIYTSSTSYSLSIPLTATAGTHRMRLREAMTYIWALSTSMDPCSYYDGTNYYYYGQTADYLADIVTLPSCSGITAGGSVSATVSAACTSDTFVVNLSASTDASGITYQWQSSTDSTTWTNISGATGTNYTATGITATTYYQCVSSCTDGSSATSSVAAVTYSPCYCTPETYYSYYYGSSYGYYYYYAINYFSLTGYSGSSINDSLGDVYAAYANRTGVVSAVSLQQGGSYSGYVRYNYDIYGFENAIWIDFNDDGTFAASENVTGTFGSTGYAYATSSSYTMNIPGTATTGTHRMRLREVVTYSGALSATMDPCGYYDGASYYYYNQTADYVANIVLLPACSGTPAAGAVATTASSVCSADTFTVSLSGYTVASGISCQWQSSTDSATWTNISGATNTTYTTTDDTVTTYFQCVVSCSDGSASATSTAVTVLHTPCYCTPAYYYSAYYGYAYYWYTGIGYFTMSGYGTSSISDTLSGLSVYYANRTVAVGAVGLQRGGSYSGVVGYNYEWDIYENAIWIDINDDGTFDASENVTGTFGLTGYTYATSSAFTASIPDSATIGLHRMRLREAVTYSWTLSGSMDACNSYDASNYYYYGQSADYLADIIDTTFTSPSGSRKAGNALQVSNAATAEMTFNVSPNPTSGTVKIAYELPASGAASIRILNAAGQVMYTTALGDQQKGDVSIDISTFPAGMYMVIFEGGDNVVTRRLIKN
jgi:GEVED domain/Secretion system C-terminal sorting domain